MPCFRGGFSQRASPTPNTQQGGGGGGFVTPDIINNLSFESGFAPNSPANAVGNMTDWDTISTPTGCSISTTQAFNLSHSINIPVITRSGVGNDSWAHMQMLISAGGLDECYARFYFWIDSVVDQIAKFHRWNDAGINNDMGGYFLKGNQGLSWVWDKEDSAQSIDLNIPFSSFVGSGWHYVEQKYTRNNDPSGFPAVTTWFDGVQKSFPNGPAIGGSTSFWLNGVLYAGERNSTAQLSRIFWCGTLNPEQTHTGNLYIDYVAYSTKRIGP